MSNLKQKILQFFFLSWYSYMVTNLKLRNFITTWNVKPCQNHVLYVKSKAFTLIVLLYVLLHLSTISSKLSIYPFFKNKVVYLQILFFKVLSSISNKKDTNICCGIFVSYYFSNFFWNIFVTIQTMSYCYHSHTRYPVSFYWSVFDKIYFISSIIYSRKLFL